MPFFLPAALCYSKYASKIAILRVTIIQKDKKKNLEFDIEANNLKKKKVKTFIKRKYLHSGSKCAKIRKKCNIGNNLHRSFTSGGVKINVF